MLPMGCRLIGLLAVFCISSSSSSATPLPFFSSVEGSTDEEEPGNLTQVVHVGNSSHEYQTTPVGPVHVETDFLSQAVTFLEENMLLILVSCSLILLSCLIVCGAIFMSHRRKVNAYYPSSFPSKMYVDQRDKSGGAKLFNEVPEKAAPEPQAELLDSHKELQAAIMKAAKNLRTPTKPVADAAGGPGTVVEDHRPEDSPKPDSSVPDNQPAGVPEEKEPSEQPESDAAPGTGGPEPNPPQPPQPQDEDDSQESVAGKNMRPSSLHIHSDSATLQLIAGEKTAF